MRCGRWIFSLVVALGAVPALGAQTQVPDTARHDVVLVNPFSLLFLGVSGEYEHVITPSVTFALGASVYPQNEIDYSSATAKIRLYPQERAPAGFSVAGGVGVARVQRGSGCGWFDDSCPSSTGSVTAPTIGVSVDYSWLLGPTRHFVVGIGLGAQRLIGTSDADDAETVLPMGRFGIGYAF